MTDKNSAQNQKQACEALQADQDQSGNRGEDQKPDAQGQTGQGDNQKQKIRPGCRDL
jgi:hypothetical protein